MLAEVWDYLFGSPAFLIFGVYTIVMIIGLGLLLHVQLGLSGVGNFGVAGFWGFGLYTFGILVVEYDAPFLVAIVGATVASGAAGALIGWIIADLDNDGVLGVTLAFASLVFLVIESERDVTGGHVGLGTLDFPFDAGGRTDLAWLAILVAVVGVLIYYVHRVHHSPYGRLLIATGSNKPLARSLRKPVKRTTVTMMTWTSAWMGFFGALYGPIVHFLFPTQLTVAITVSVITALVLGGQQRPWGAVVGALLTLGLFDIVIKLYVPLPKSALEQAFPVAKQMILGALLIIVLMFKPLGVLGRMRREDFHRPERRAAEPPHGASQSELQGAGHE